MEDFFSICLEKIIQMILVCYGNQLSDLKMKMMKYIKLHKKL